MDIEFYLEFWDEYDEWPSKVYKELLRFIERLQRNPDSPSIKPFVDWRGRSYVEFCDGFYVFWRVKRQKTTVRSVLGSKPTLIRILAIERK
jgi:hypothetical protein